MVAAVLIFILEWFRSGHRPLAHLVGVAVPNGEFQPITGDFLQNLQALIGSVVRLGTATPMFCASGRWLLLNRPNIKIKIRTAATICWVGAWVSRTNRYKATNLDELQFGSAFKQVQINSRRVLGHPNRIETDNSCSLDSFFQKIKATSSVIGIV